MSAELQSQTDDTGRSRPIESTVTSCRSSPGRVVFLETGNTDGWIASDTTTEVTR
ncbi:hypothetical protein [Natronomonas sp. EA1]|uniref:hypothetical protein n=1 Tax=Natronomonas sp. EA1 TaxID=3421655 RepID=UPI003EBDF1FD